MYFIYFLLLLNPFHYCWHIPLLAVLVSLNRSFLLSTVFGYEIGERWSLFVYLLTYLILSLLWIKSCGVCCLVFCWWCLVCWFGFVWFFVYLFCFNSPSICYHTYKLSVSSIRQHLPVAPGATGIAFWLKSRFFPPTLAHLFICSPVTHFQLSKSGTNLSNLSVQWGKSSCPVWDL